MRAFRLAALLCCAVAVDATPTVDEQRRQPFTVDELLTMTFPKKTSNDSGANPCKSENLLFELPLEQVSTKYAQQIQTAGLQIEEEGLPDYVLNRIKRPEYHTKTKSSNYYSESLPIASRMFNEDEFQDLPKNDEREEDFNELNGPIFNNQQVRMSQNRYRNRRRRKNSSSRNRKTKLEMGFSTTPHIRKTRAATALKERLWDDGVVPYEIDEEYTGVRKALVKQAMRHWENYTCIKFVEKGPEHKDYIFFTEKACGCCSFVGKKGIGLQALSIGGKCAKFGIVVHEIGHALGYYHEHTRPDRDNFVQITKENIVKDQEANFDKLTTEQVNSLGEKYDYDSIMHYARNTYSKTVYLDTIVPLDSSAKYSEIGQRVKLSHGDITQTNLLYNCPKCGNTLQAAAANFSSPTVGNSSESSEVFCEWRISATHGEKIVLNITEIDIKETPLCETDYLEIRDGYWNRSNLIGRFCGNKQIPNMVSTGNRMLVTYRAKHTNEFKGFKAAYEAKCGGDIVLTSEYHLESPNFPELYQPNKTCIWRITVPEDFHVALRFHSFDIEKGEECEKEEECSYDSLEIRDGLTQEAKLIGTYCGQNLPPDVVSSSNSLMVRFVTDNSVGRNGFSAKIYKEFDECSRADHGCEQECINTFGSYQCSCRFGYELHSDGKTCVDACGGSFTSSFNGTVTSPSFPEIYPKNKNCIWEISAPKGHVIFLNFTHLDIEGNNYAQQICEYDRVDVFSNFGNKMKKHISLCGSKVPQMIVSESHVMRIRFVSDASVEKTGFAAVYFMDINECLVNNGGCHHECVNTLGSFYCACRSGFTLAENQHSCQEGDCVHKITTPPYGSFSSPNYPSNYPPRKDCVWSFSTLPGHRVRLAFFTFMVEFQVECHYDYVDIFDGSSSLSLLLGRFCGSDSSMVVLSSENELYMTFKSDASIEKKGFRGSHSTVCGGMLKATEQSKRIYSHPKYGNESYEASLKCDWWIEADEGFDVQVHFLELDLEEEVDCLFDFVEVFEGSDPNDSLSLGRFCGNKKPFELVSTEEALYIQFRTNSEVGKKGFVLTYKAVEHLEPSYAFEEYTMDKI